MELIKKYPVSALRTLTKYGQFHQETDSVNKDLLCKSLSNIQSQFTTLSVLELLLSDGILKESNGHIYPVHDPLDFDWLNYLLNDGSSALVLGFPGTHTQVMMEELEKRGLQYIDHDAAWRSLIRNSSDSLDIISPFIDPEGIEIFAGDLIKALRNNVAVRIITRGFDSSTYSQKRSAVECLVKTVKSEYEASDLRLGYFHDGSLEEKSKHLGSVHAKVLIQDHRRAYVGSGEFRKNSAFLNLEVGFVNTGTNEIRGLTTVFDVFWQLCDVRPWSDAI